MVIFDTKYLLELAKDFHCLTGASISIWDSNFNELCVYPEHICQYCKIVKSYEEGREKCLSSDKTACIKVKKTNDPYYFRCHAGLLDTVLPLRIDHTTVAYIMFGQVRDVEEQIVTLESVIECAKAYGISKEDAEKYFYQLPTLSHEQIEAAANFLKRSTLYLTMTQAIRVEKNEITLKIDNYINENLSNIITVKKICDDLLIPKNTLYQISNKYFKTTIKKYITLKRIEKAKHLLADTTLPISDICEEIGVTDYNYFIRFFKKNVGYSPLKYRKLFSQSPNI